MDRQTDTRFSVKYPVSRTSSRGFMGDALSQVPLIQTDYLIVNSGASLPIITVSGIVTDSITAGFIGVTNLHGNNITTTTLTGTTIYNTNINSTNSTISTLTGTLIYNTDFRSTNSFVTNFTGTNTYLSFFAVREGTNRRMGTALLPTGSPNQVTVNNTSITNTTRVFLTAQTGTVANMGFLSVPNRSVGTSFVIQSSSTTDNSTVAWLLIEPGA